MNKSFFNKKGSALLSVMIMTAILTIFGLIILNISFAETNYAVYVEKNSQAHYIARAGADAMAAYLRDNPDELSQLVISTNTVPGTGEIAGGAFHVTVTELSSGQVFIRSESEYLDAPKSVVTLLLNRSFGGFDHALFSDEPLSLGNSSSTIYGDVGTNSNHDNSLGSNAIVDGSLYFGPGTVIESDGNITAVKEKNIDTTRFSEGIFVMDEIVPFPEIATEDFPAAVNQQIIPVVVDSDGYYSDLTDSVTFNTGSGEKLMVRLDSVDLIGNREILVTGDVGNGGELHLLVTDILSVSGTAVISVENGARVFIYYTGNTPVVLNGGGYFEGIIYAPHSSVTWNGGANTIMNGSIVAQQVDMANSQVELIYDGGFDYMGLAINDIAIYRRYEYGQ